MRSNHQVLGDTELQTAVLESNAAAANYHSWLCALALPYLGDNPIEIGSGTGEYAETWLNAGLRRITLTEVDPSRLRITKERFADDDRVTFDSIDLDGTEDADFSAVVSFNVMEHIPNDHAALRAAKHAVRVGGAVVTFAPAFPFAMSRFDRDIGHVRRYTRKTLSSAYEAAGLDVEVCRYVNAPGLLAWTVGMRALRMTPKDGPSLQLWDRYVVPFARSWEERHKVPFGQSVFCVGRRP